MDKQTAFIAFGLALGVVVIAQGVAKQSGAVLGLTAPQIASCTVFAAVIVPKLMPPRR